MSMKDDFQLLAVDLINEVFADISVEMTYNRPLSETYDPVGGEIIKSTVSYPVTCILGSFTRDLPNAQDFLSTDTRCVIPFLNFQTGDAPRALRDSLMARDGTLYNIISVAKDAAEASYVLQLRVDV